MTDDGFGPPVLRMASTTVFSNSTTATYYPLVVATNPLPFTAGGEAQDGTSMLIGGFLLSLPSPTNGLHANELSLLGVAPPPGPLPRSTTPGGLAARLRLPFILLALEVLFLLLASSMTLCSLLSQLFLI